MCKPESIQENDSHEILWDFEIETDYQILARRLDLVWIKKKKRTCRLVDFDVPADHRVKMKKNETIENYLDLARELKKKNREYKSDSDTNCSWTTWNNSQRLGKKIEGIRNQEELTPSRPQHYQNWLEYSEESWKHILLER